MTTTLSFLLKNVTIMLSGVTQPEKIPKGSRCPAKHSVLVRVLRGVRAQIDYDAPARDGVVDRGHPKRRAAAVIRPAFARSNSTFVLALGSSASAIQT